MAGAPITVLAADHQPLYRDALAIAEQLSMQPLQAHFHFGLGALHRQTGRPERARAELDLAIDLYLSMDMTHWIPRAEAELAELIASPAERQVG